MEIHPSDDADRLRAIWDAKKQSLGLTQESFGKTYGIGTQGYVRQLLTGERPLNAKVATAFAQALKCQVKDFSPSIAREIEKLTNANSPKLGGISKTIGAIVPIALQTSRLPVFGVRIMSGGLAVDIERAGAANAPGKNPDAYVWRVKSSDVYPAIKAGTYLVIEPSRKPRAEEMVLIHFIDGSARICEFISGRADGISVNNLVTERRESISRDLIKDLHSVTWMGPASVFEDDDSSED